MVGRAEGGELLPVVAEVRVSLRIAVEGEGEVDARVGGGQSHFFAALAEMFEVVVHAGDAHFDGDDDESDGFRLDIEEELELEREHVGDGVVVTEDAREWLRRVQGADVRRVRVFLADDGQRPVLDSVTPHRGWDAKVFEDRAEESFSTCVIKLGDLRWVGGVVLVRAEGAAEAALDENDSDLMELGPRVLRT